MTFFETISSLNSTEKAFWGSAAVVGIPLCFNLIKDIIFDARKRREERAYISVQLIFLLDKFVSSCADVAWDEGYDPTNQPPNESDYEDQVKIPIFDMSNVKGEHKYLKPEMLYRLHKIEIELNKARNKLFNENYHNEWRAFGETHKYYTRRRELYAEVGLMAASIADDLRDTFNIKVIEGWEPSKRIQDSLNSINSSRIVNKKIKNRRKKERIKKCAKEREESFSE